MPSISKEKLDKPLGSYEKCEEFQVGVTIVWVYTNNELGKEGSIEKANKYFDEFWSDRKRAVKAAEIESRRMFPVPWGEHDNSNVSDHPLSVWGICYYPDINEAHYDVNINWRYSGISDFEEESIVITRDSNSEFRAS